MNEVILDGVFPETNEEEMCTYNCYIILHTHISKYLYLQKYIHNESYYILTEINLL